MPKFNFEAIGTKWQIDICQALSPEKEALVFSAVKSRIELFDKAYSRFRDDSLVTEMSKKSGVYVLPEDAEPMLSLYHDLYLKTNGLVTPLVGNLISDAGYDSVYSLQQKKELTAAPLWDDVMEYKHPNLTIKEPVLLDFGAAGKGYLVDLVGKVLEEHGVTGYCVDAGGDILYRGAEAITVGLENPLDASQVIGVCSLASGSICGSAGNRRTWGEFTHIINPKTLVSPAHILAVWVTAPTALLADMLATCLFFAEAAPLTETYQFEYVIVRSDMSLEKSAHFSGEIFTSQTNKKRQ